MSSVLAKTDAAGGASLHPKVLEFSSSLKLDRQLVREDLIGSLAHVIMLSRTKLIAESDARAIHKGLVGLYEEAAKGTLQLPDEEDVHMAVESLLAARIGQPSKSLHTARSRNDQVATDLRLHVREQCSKVLGSISSLVKDIARYAEAGKDLLLPSYTHRQRAQPISLAYWWASWGFGFLRDAEAFAYVLDQADALSLGVGAISGTSLGNDREVLKKLLGFSRLTSNGLDTVGDRDFAMDYLYAATRLGIRIGRLSAELVDFSTQEFGFVQLDGEIACGSSMMPHKKNPDVFELLRGRSGVSIGTLTGLLATVKGLPGGYFRDLQEDRGPLLETTARIHESLSVLQFALSHVKFDADKCGAGLVEGSTQATDLAEALVKTGLPFREAYQIVGRLVRAAKERKVGLAQLPANVAAELDSRLTPALLTVLSPAGAVAHKKSIGSTGPEAVAAQLQSLAGRAQSLDALVKGSVTLDSLFVQLKEEALKPS